MKSLVKRAQRGDDQAFVELIEENKQAMYKVAVGILKNDFDAADAIQESILTCYEKLKELKKAQYFKTWLLRILINNCNQMLREQKKVVGIEDYYGAEDAKGKKAEEKIAAPPGAATINEDFLELFSVLLEHPVLIPLIAITMHNTVIKTFFFIRFPPLIKQTDIHDK